MALKKVSFVLNGLAVWDKCNNFTDEMRKSRKETITVRILSTCFIVIALAVFKPLGLGSWHWKAYVHLLLIGVLGFFVCMLTDAFLKYVLKKPVSYSRGVGHVIRRNLWFQLINTPLIALLICVYRHVVLDHNVADNKFTWVNYLSTLLIIAFCSFVIGLYWRFKYRSQYLASELEETRSLNEQLMSLQREAEEMSQKSEAVGVDDGDGLSNPSFTITLKGTTNESVTLRLSDLLYIEADGNYLKVFHMSDGRVRADMIRATSKQLEDDLHMYPMIVRCHRAFLVNLQQVEQIVSKSGSMHLVIKHIHESVPVSRSNMAQVKESISLRSN